MLDRRRAGVAQSSSTFSMIIAPDRLPPWRSAVSGSLQLWIAGYLHGMSDATLVRRLAAAGVANAEETLSSLDGHFALMAQDGGDWFAAVDRVRSIPLFWLDQDGMVMVSPSARQLLARQPQPVDPEQASVFAMSGYTMAGRTLYRKLNELKPGEWMASIAGRVVRGRYWRYQPWRTQRLAEVQWSERLVGTTLAVFEKMIEGIKGRCVLVPLSAGLDSRLVAAALKHLGYRNVKCFAYGLPSNFEAVASRSVAERLGYEWTFVPHSPAQQARLFGGEIGRAYDRQSDTLAAVPFPQDLHAVSTLLANGYVGRDVVVVNGQSGDYITGNHVPAGLFEPGQGGEGARWQRIVDALVAKHYSLWGSLKTPANLAQVDRLVRQDCADDGVALGEPALDYAVYEYSEYQNRQAKYVVNGQRVYEFLGLDWRLPLWDRDFVDFWESVPIEHKQKQTLYRETLIQRNLSGVWERGSWPRTVSPHWLRPVRWALKAAHLPLGNERWHRFERRYLAYWMDVVANYAVVDYATVMRDRRDHRNAISWHVERYLADKGLGFDGAPLLATT
jgi:asparagine synthase (glutamine-hydrolysing)